MASQHGAPPVFNNKVVAWIDHRLPIFSYIEKEYHTFPTPRNFNYFWNFGAIATVMLVLMIATIGQLFCTTACLTSASRMLFAFSRDGAVPGAKYWARVNKSKTPVYAVIAVTVVATDWGATRV